MTEALGLLCYGLIFLFGIAVSFGFSGVERSRKNMTIAVGFFLFGLVLQIISWRLFGLERTKELYPLIVHLPLILLLVFVFKRSFAVAFSSVFAAYLCCQIPRWISSIGELVFQTRLSFHLIYIPALFLCYYCLRKYVETPVYRIMLQSRKSCFLFGAVPLFYYVFDYVTTIYTDWLYSGSFAAVQFIPSVVSVFYFVFVLAYYAETQKEKTAQQERDLMETQLGQARMEFDTLRRMQEQTLQYRHDMRHHFKLLQGLASEGKTEKITDYLKTAESDLDAFTPTRYCENETVNLLLSSFDGLAKQKGVSLSVETGIPQKLSLSDTELCSLLSNSLENAISAASVVPGAEKRVVSVKIKVHKENLLLSVENPYVGEVVLQKGLPQATKDGHGYGTRNITAIAELHGGQALYSAFSGVFTLKVMIPLG